MLVDSYIVIASKVLHYWSLPVAADTELQLTGMHVPMLFLYPTAYKHRICPVDFLPTQILGNNLPCQTVLLACCIAMVVNCNS